MVQNPHNLYGEITSPTYAKLCFMIFGTALSFALLFLSCHMNKTNTAYFWLATLGGLILWQVIGECSYNFYIQVKNEIIYFPKIENISSLFIIVPVTALCIYVLSERFVNESLKVYIISFMNNWLPFPIVCILFWRYRFIPLVNLFIHTTALC